MYYQTDGERNFHVTGMYPPDDDFHGEQDEIIDDAKIHQSLDVKTETDRRERHQDSIAAGLGQLLLPGIIARAVERVKVEKRRDLMIHEQRKLAANRDDHESCPDLNNKEGK